MATMTRTNKDDVRRAFEALNQRDRDAFARLHADDAVVRTVDEEYRGVDEILAEEFGLFDAFSDLSYALEDVVAEDDLVAARWTAAGTHDGPFGGVEATGESVAFPVAGTFRVESERVTDAWTLPDRLGLLAQFGVEPSPEDP